MTASGLRAAVAGVVDRFRGGTVQCFVCQRPLDEDDAVELRNGELAHRSCARLGQAFGRASQRRDRGQAHLGPIVFVAAMLLLALLGLAVTYGGWLT